MNAYERTVMKVGTKLVECLPVIPRRQAADEKKAGSSRPA